MPVGSQIPIAEGLFTWPADDPALIGAQCRDCEAVAFPFRETCPRCGAISMYRNELPREGNLWTWTSQGFRPKEPFCGDLLGTGAQPWFVGLVELGGRIRVESILHNVAEQELVIGMPLKLTVIPFRRSDSGDTVVTFAFEPAPHITASDSTEAAHV